MIFSNTPIEGLLVLTPKVFADNRGYFYESYNKQTLLEAGITADFVQDNESFSMQNTLRGLHFQKPPFAQAKLVRVLEGTVWDVAVDLRRDSPTFGQWFGVELSAENKNLPINATIFITKPPRGLFTLPIKTWRWTGR